VQQTFGLLSAVFVVQWAGGAGRVEPQVAIDPLGDRPADEVSGSWRRCW
jgi:hypothetical protein